MATNNATILDRIRLNGTLDYQQRIPEATQAGVAGVQKALYTPLNKQFFNEFVDGLINRIGSVIVHNRRWENPLAVFKRPTLQYGQTIQEIATKLIKARGYDLEASDAFRVNRPEALEAFHSVNRQDRYDITVNMVELRKAFETEFGLNEFVNNVLEIPFTSDNADEFSIMKQLIAEYDAEHGFYNVNAEIPTDEASAKTLLKQIRTLGKQAKFITKATAFNAAGVPTFTPMDKLVLITTPEVLASIDVDALAAAFNVPYADVMTRVVEIDEFPDSTIALLVDESFFVCADYVLENQAQYNPANLSTTYFLHHWGVYSTSPFVTAIRFSEDADTNIPEIDATAEAFTFEVQDLETGVATTTVEVDTRYKLVSEQPFDYSEDNRNLVDALKGATYDIRTSVGFVNGLTIEHGADGSVIYIPDGQLVAGDTITISATAIYQNPTDGRPDGSTVEVVLTVA